MANIREVFLETCPPGGDRGGHMSKVVIVTFLPEAPSSYEKDVHDHLAPGSQLQV